MYNSGIEPVCFKVYFIFILFEHFGCQKWIECKCNIIQDIHFLSCTIFPLYFSLRYVFIETYLVIDHILLLLVCLNLDILLCMTLLRHDELFCDKSQIFMRLSGCFFINFQVLVYSTLGNDRNSGWTLIMSDQNVYMTRIFLITLCQ